ncbi:uncharacterized protein [Amphiura filiformis]|uniref:uncharacterized protein n=1 Tax=Amphiura filiformis TaxID=82378 RepID=UPI003B214CC8
MDRKKKPPVALPVKDRTIKPALTRTTDIGTHVNAPRLGIGGGDEDHPTMEPIQIVTPANVQGAPNDINYKKGRNSSGEKFRNFLKGLSRNQEQKPSVSVYAMDQKKKKKKPPVALPVKDTTKKPALTGTQSPVYDNAVFATRLGIGGGDEEQQTDVNIGYLEPIQIVAPPNVQGAPSGTNNQKRQNSSGEKFYQAQKPSIVYAEPYQFEGTGASPVIVGDSGGYIDLKSGDDKYSQFVISGGAIYANNSRNPSQDPVLQSNDRHVSKSERMTECLPTFALGRSKRWILGLVVTVILLVLIMIALFV